MIVDCPNCQKKFDVKKDLIPDGGRTLQCGSCNHKWFYTTKAEKKIIKIAENDEIPNRTEEIIKEAENNINKTKTENKSDIKRKIKSAEKVEKNVNLENTNNSFSINKGKDKNYLKILLVFIISFFALILITDTFKYQISLFVPNIELILSSFYETIKDINLFLKDLIN